jgi:threonine dehydrogenase-like Zn-dependent dehydrogenase
LPSGWGADIVIDPRELSPFGPIHQLGMRRATLVYECVGVPGLLKQIIGSVGFGARIVMGGYCLEPEELLVFSAQNKRLSILFACGEEQQDMELALRSIADGTIDITSWLGRPIGLTDVAGALDAMSNPASPVRTVVDPRRM